MTTRSPLSSGDRSNLSLVCNALAQKASIIPSVLGSSLVFSTVQSDCAGESSSQAGVEVVIQGNSPQNVFKTKSNNQDFIFPEVETTSSGLW